ncbi:endonuclease [Thermotomaculum hydrothermale]|uniref:Endonuclease n=1 Tax=Thermotomaculum hydrothermale TaxID=981385 RepID=A0A7R6PG04_9BACT|nr:endonuclease [Thermotomaculum hydrothermale]BBB33049.1 endonuclease [Thermotomaculum hydrothermale]
MYYVYLIQNEEGKRYIGYTKDLKRRISEHNSNDNTSTKRHQWELIYYEAYKSEKDAKTREQKLKQDGRSRRQLYQRVNNSLNR